MRIARRLAPLVTVAGLLFASPAFAQSNDESTEQSADAQKTSWFLGISPTGGYSTWSPEGPSMVMFNAAPLTVEARLTPMVGLRTSTMLQMRYSDALYTSNVGLAHSVPLYFDPFAEGGGQMYAGPMIAGSYQLPGSVQSGTGASLGLGAQVGWAAPIGKSFQINVGLSSIWALGPGSIDQPGVPSVGLNLDLGWWVR